MNSQGTRSRFAVNVAPVIALIKTLRSLPRVCHRVSPWFRTHGPRRILGGFLSLLMLLQPMLMAVAARSASAARPLIGALLMGQTTTVPNVSGVFSISESGWQNRIVLSLSGASVEGYSGTSPANRIVGTMSGNVFTGTWGNNAGQLTMTFSSDGSSFSGKWSCGTTTPTTALTGTRQANSVAVVVTPAASNVAINGKLTFAGKVVGSTNQTINWSVTSANGGSITSPGGVYTAPAAAGSYYVRAAPAADTTQSVLLIVWVPANPVASITAKSPVTSAEPGQLASVPYQESSTFAWNITNGTITNVNSYQVAYTPGSVGTCTLTCTVTNAAGVSATGTSTVQVIAAPAITSFAASKSSVSPGEAFSLTGTYSNGLGTIDQGVGSAPSGTAVPVATTISKYYWLTVTNPAGSLAQKYLQVTVCPTPDAAVTAASPVTSGESNACYAQVNAVPSGTYAWSVSNGTISGQGTSYSVYCTPGAVGTCTLTCKVTNAAGVSATGSARVTVVAAPTITDFTASKTSVSPGETFTLKGTFANGKGAIDHGVGSVSSATPVSVKADVSKYYYLTVTNPAGSTVNKYVYVTVTPTPDVTVTAVSPVTTGATSCWASVNAISGGAYAWSITNGTISGQATSSTVYYTPGAVGTCTLTCKVTNAAGVSATGSASVKVIAAPTITDFIASKTSVSPGESFTLQGTFANGKGVIDQGVGSVSSATPVTVKTDVSKYYYLTVTNLAGATVTKSLNITVTPAPDAIVTAASPVTTGTAGCLASVNSLSGGTYAWSITNGTIPDQTTSSYIYYTPGTVGTCTLTCKVTNAAGVSATGSATTITAGQSVMLTPVFSGGNGSIDYGVGKVTSGVAVSLTPRSSGYLTLLVTNRASAIASKNVYVTVNPAVTGGIVTPSVVTTGTDNSASVPYDASSTYLWTVTKGSINSGSTSYGVSYKAGSVGTSTLQCVITKGGVSTTRTVNVAVIAAPSISAFTASKTSVSPGDTFTLTPVFSNGTGVVNGGIGPVSSGTAVSTTLKVTANFTLTVINAAGTQVTAAVAVSVLNAPDTFISAPSPVTTGLTSSANASYQGGATYIWSITGGTIQSGAGTYSISYLPGAVGTCTLTCVITNTAGVTRTATKTVSIIAAPQVSIFTSSKTSISPGGTFMLTGVFSNGNGLIDQGLGPVVSGTGISATASVSKSFNLQVTNAAGSSVGKSLLISVNGPPDATLTAANPVTTAKVAYASVPYTSGGTYVWSITGGTIQSGAGTYSISYLPGAVGTCTLTCVVTNAAGVSRTGTASVSIVAAPVIAAFTISKAHISAGGTFTLTPQFSNGQGAINRGIGAVVSGTAVSTSTQASGSYQLTVTNAAGDSVFSSVSVTVDPAPQVVITAQSPITAGAKNCLASVPPVYGSTYQWSLNSGLMDSAYVTNPTLNFTAGPVGKCTLTCKVTNAAGVTQTGTTTLDVIPAPEIQGFTMTRDIRTVGGASVLQGYFKNGVGVVSLGVGPVSSGFSKTVSPTIGASYQLTVTNAAGTSTNALASPLAMWISPKAAALPAGFAQRFLAGSNLGTPLAVDWSVRESGGGTVSQDGLYKAPQTPGTYHLDIAAKSDATLKASAAVTVPVLLGIDPEYVEMKPGATSTFRGVFTGIPALPVSWNGGSATTLPYVYTAPTTPGRCVITATCTGGSAKAIIDVVSDGGLSVSVTPSEVDLGKNGTATFTAQVDGGKTRTVTWSCNGGSINASTGAYTAPNALGSYTVKATCTEDSSAYGTATVTVRATSGTDKSFTYDANGNMTSDGSRTFEWDAENRLVAVVTIATGHRSEFGYDELGRRVQIEELDPDANKVLQTTSDKKYLWDGVEIAEERDATGAIVTKRFYSQGFVDSDGTILFYTRDHLGSIRELTDGSQTIRARYDYDSFGRATKIQGDRDSQFTYTGHFWHGQSGLNLATYRAYDPNLGRWISRDAAGERGGVNLYQYVLNDPTNLIDPSGHSPWRPVPGSGGWDTRHDPSAGGGDPAHDHYRDPRGRDYDRRVYPDGTQKPHGDGGLDKDVPQDVIDKNPRNKPKKPSPDDPEPSPSTYCPTEQPQRPLLPGNPLLDPNFWKWFWDFENQHVLPYLVPPRNPSPYPGVPPPMPFPLVPIY